MRLRLILVLLLALVLRLALWSQPLHQPANDEEEYIAVAYDLLAGRGWSFYDQYHWLRAPLYPLFLAGSLWLTGGDLHRAALPNIILSVATVYLIYRLTALLTSSSRARLLAALLAALLLTLNTFASLSMSETLFAFLFTAVLVVLVQWQHHIHQAASPRHVALIALAGLLLGLTTLTRSLSLAFLPVVLLWIVAQWRVSGKQTAVLFRQQWAVATLFAVCLFATIAPWTLRNCQAYGRCILVETGFSYNVWAFNEPRESRDTIFRTLESISNPAERADEATRRGLERLREDPAILLRKLWPNWVYLWRVKPIQDRFLMASYYSDPPPLLFLVALLLDDALYMVILFAAIVGYIFAAPRLFATLSLAELLRLFASPKGLLLLWLLYVVVATMLTHGEARYRHFLFPVLLPYAAIALAGDRGERREEREQRQPIMSILASTIIIPLMLYTVLTTYPWEWATTGARRSFCHLTGDIAAARGDLDRAAAAYERALEVDKTPDGFLALGDVLRQQGDMQGADAAYRSARRRKPLYIAATARLGDLWRAQGDDEQARRYFKGTHADEQQVIDWTWDNLDPPPVKHIAVGDGLDFGYVAQVYPAEPQQGALARWSNGNALFRLALRDTPQNEHSQHSIIVQMRVAAPHPHKESVAAQVCSGNACQPVMFSHTWRIVSLVLPVDTAAQRVVIDGTAWYEQTFTVHSPTFHAADGRSLGVLVDWVRVVE